MAWVSGVKSPVLFLAVLVTIWAMYSAYLLYWFHPEEARTQIQNKRDMAVLKHILPRDTWRRSQLKAVEIAAPERRFLQTPAGYAGFLVQTSPEGLDALLKDTRWRKWDRLRSECADGQTTYGVANDDPGLVWRLGKSGSFEFYESFFSRVIVANRTVKVGQQMRCYRERLDAVLVCDDSTSPTIRICITTSPLWYSDEISDITTPPSAERPER
jgi:hypothetical protein